MFVRNTELRPSWCAAEAADQQECQNRQRNADLQSAEDRPQEKKDRIETRQNGIGEITAPDRRERNLHESFQRIVNGTSR